MQLETATLAGGCFWCTEAIFRRLKGVERVTPGYTGGEIENPTYEQVSSGKTGHAEAIQIKFDAKIISYETLLDIFWHLHDPTTLNRQGADTGTQYRSAVFYHTEAQRKTAEAIKQELNDSDDFKNPIVTEIVPAVTFYPAEDFHENYYENNHNFPYCRIVIDPKIKKLLGSYAAEVKDEYKANRNKGR